ncbi:MAG: hypothetical protein OXI87_00565 [Albidovulum sp.]|nr:hypothetical protein [Albidovulum sp.]MDE0303365.1 hypothetical protein [Albidovulum sp.]MDE0534239.1 hypothetical protein [Albidovulum sp.]
MLVIAGFACGAVFGALVARKKGGNKFDIAQYAAGYGIAAAILGLFSTIVAGWLLGTG